jgi:hypothetical protein
MKCVWMKKMQREMSAWIRNSLSKSREETVCVWRQQLCLIIWCPTAHQNPQVYNGLVALNGRTLMNSTFDFVSVQCRWGRLIHSISSGRVGVYGRKLLTILYFIRLHWHSKSAFLSLSYLLRISSSVNVCNPTLLTLVWNSKRSGFVYLLLQQELRSVQSLQN